MTRREAGFTLIEVAVALALSALVSLILLQGIRLAVTGFERHTRAAERLDARQSLDALLRRVLGSAIMVSRIAGSDFVGRPDAVEFLGAADDAGPGLYRIDLGIDPARRGRPLVLRRRLAAPDGDPREAASIVATQVRTFRLAYFGSDAGDAAPAWHDSWQHLANLPLMVRVILDSDDAPSRPPLIVHLWNAGNG